MPAPTHTALALLCALAPSAAFAGPTPDRAPGVQPASMVPQGGAAGPAPAKAEEPQQKLRGWIEQVLGAGAKLTRQGDHWRITYSLGALPGISSLKGGDIAFSAYPLIGGRWVFYDYGMNSPLSFRADLPPASAGIGVPSKMRPLEVTVSFGQLGSDAIVDPEFATPSTLMTRLERYDVFTRSGAMRQRLHFDSADGQMTAIPDADGRIDVTGMSRAEEFAAVVVNAPDLPPAALAIGRVQLTAALRQIDRKRALAAMGSLYQVSNQALAAMPSRNGENGGAAASGAEAPTPKPGRPDLRALYTMLRGIAGGGEISETLEDVRGEAGGHMGAIGHMSIGADIGAPNGSLIAHLSFASPDIPPEARAFVPRHVLVQPTFSGMDLAELDALIMAATAPGAKPSLAQPEIARRIAALFAHGGITAGLDTLELDLGDTRFGATGKITALAPDRYKGEAEVTATGFDALVAKVQATPEIAKAAPFVQLLGKIGHAEGERIVWTIISDNADVKVNGLDISAMLAVGKEHEK